MNQYYVLLENNQPIGIAREAKQPQVREWEAAAPNRRAVLVEECT